MTDFLEPKTAFPDDGLNAERWDNQTRLLKIIERNLRKIHPSQRCVLDLQFNPQAGVLNTGTDICHIQFKNEGKPVLAQYVVISNNTTDFSIHVSINEPLQISPTGAAGNGIILAPNVQTYIKLPLEIEFIEVGLLTATAANAIPVNNSAAITIKGMIQVYAWTIPEGAMLT